jgi:hypothetical protein
MEKKQTNKNSTLTSTANPEIIPFKPTHREPCTFKDVQDDIIRTTMAMKDTEHTAIVFSSCTLTEEKDENGDLRVGCTPSSIVGGNLYAQLACTASLISSISDTMEQTPAEVLGLLADMLEANEDSGSPSTTVN